jgi:hypothetical protein
MAWGRSGLSSWSLTAPQCLGMSLSLVGTIRGSRDVDFSSPFREWKAGSTAHSTVDTL